MAESTGERISLVTTKSRSSSSANYGTELINIHGTEYRQVPIKQAYKINGFTLVLYDASEQVNPFPIWKGTVLAENNFIKGKESSAFAQLIAELGISKEGYRSLKVNQYLNQEDKATTQTFYSPYFSVEGIRINETAGKFSGAVQYGYIKTRKVKTRYFEGFVQTFGLQKYSGVSSEDDELVDWSIGLGAYTVYEDGVYTTQYNTGGLRELDRNNVVKVFHLPLKVGDKTEINGPVGSKFRYDVFENGSVETLAGNFSKCFSIHQYITYQSGNVEGPSISWICEGMGIVKQELTTGRIDLLTNQVNIIR